jgi:hypothetical protein
MTDAEKIKILREMTGREPVVRHNPRESMQRVYGLLHGRKCGECRHRLHIKYANPFYKCALWMTTGNRATDIRLKDTACRKFEAGEGKEVNPR